MSKTVHRLSDGAHPLGIAFEFPKVPLVAGGAAGVAMFLPMISIFISFPSSCTLLYLLTAASASPRLENTTSAVP